MQAGDSKKPYCSTLHCWSKTPCAQHPEHKEPIEHDARRILPKPLLFLIGEYARSNLVFKATMFTCVQPHTVLREYTASGYAKIQSTTIANGNYHLLRIKKPELYIMWEDDIKQPRVPRHIISKQERGKMYNPNVAYGYDDIGTHTGHIILTKNTVEFQRDIIYFEAFKSDDPNGAIAYAHAISKTLERAGFINPRRARENSK
jgi:hypothetical protein